MGRLLELKAWADDIRLAESTFGIEPPRNLLERITVWYYRKNFGEKIKEILTADPVYAINRHIRKFNEINGTNFCHLHDVEIKDLKLKQFKKNEEEIKPVIRCSLDSVYNDFIARIPPEFQKKLLPKYEPNKSRAYYLPLETVSEIIATFNGTTTLLSPLFGDNEKEYDIRIDVVQYQNIRDEDPEKVEPEDIKIQIYIFAKNTRPCTSFEYGVDLTADTWELIKKLGILNQPGNDFIDVITQTHQEMRRRNGSLDFIYQEMWRLRDIVKKYTEGFLESNVITPTSVLTFFDHAKVDMRFDESPGDMRPQIIQQLHEGQVDGRYFYDKHGAQIYETACKSAQYVYGEAEKKLLKEHANEAIEAVNPDIVISIGCGSGEKEFDLFKDRNESKIPHFTGIDTSPVMLAYFIDRLKSLNPEVETVLDDLRKMKLLDTLNKRGLYTFLGNTLGNFSLQEQIIILSKIANKMKNGDKLLLGLNRYNQETDNPSFEYDESATEFVSGALTNINLQDRVTRSKQFDIRQKVHYVLVSIQEDCEIEINGEKHKFNAGEQAKLIQSKRYTKEEIQELLYVSGFDNFEIFENEYTLLVIASK